MRKLTLITITVLLCWTNTVSALSPEQKKIYDSNIGYFDLAETLASDCQGSTSLTGADNEAKIWGFFISQGFQPHQAAGIMGNFQAESGLEPSLVHYGGKNSRGEISEIGKPSSYDDEVAHTAAGYGLAQWVGGRKDGLRDTAAAKGVKGSDLAMQLGYVMTEFSGTHKKDYDLTMAATTVEQVSDIILKYYEGPLDQGEAVKKMRRDFSRDIMTRQGSNTGGAASSGQVVGCSSGSGQVVGGYSLPVDKQIYDKDPGVFAKTHHDYAASDIPLKEGINVYSMTAGTVISAPVGGDCGEGIMIDAGGGVTYKYCHGSDGGSVQGAKQGDKVNAGQLIMHSSYTGEVRPPGPAGTHLHVEIKVNGQLRCPQPLFKSIADGSPTDPKSLPTTGCTH